MDRSLPLTSGRETSSLLEGAVAAETIITHTHIYMTRLFILATCKYWQTKFEFFGNLGVNKEQANP